MIKLKLFVCTAFFLCGCDKNSNDIPIDSPKIEVINKLYSPDKTKLVLLYHIQNPLNLSGSLKISIINSEDTLINVYKNILPSFRYFRLRSCVSGEWSRHYFEPLKWANNKRLIVEIDSRLFARAGYPFKTKTIFLHGIEIEIHSKYLKEINGPLIYNYKLSPDKSKLLVFYRNQNLRDENVSVIEYNSSLPQYGNIYTAENPSYETNYVIQFGRWKDEIVQLAKLKDTPYSLNKNLNYKIELIEEFSKDDSLEMKEFNTSVNTDKLIDMHLKNVGDTTFGIITAIYVNNSESFYVNNQKRFYTYIYEYGYTFNGEVFKSYFVKKYKNKPDTDFLEGDKIQILFDKKQPIIQRPLINYSH